MNTLIFPSNLKLINLTPFKFSLCSLIYTLFRNTEFKTKNDIYFLTDIINSLLRDFECEISKNIFYKKLECLTNNDTLYNDIIKIIENSYNSLNNINDLYIFFNFNIRELKAKDENNNSLLENGGYIDNFIRKCLFAFYKLSFEDLYNLLKNIKDYNNNQTMKINLTNFESEELFEKQIKTISYSIINTDILSLNSQLLNSNNYPYKYYFKKDNFDEGIDNIHKFFDFNLKYFYTDSVKDNTHNKLHYSLLNLIEYYFRYNYYDAALIGIIYL